MEIKEEKNSISNIYDIGNDFEQQKEMTMPPNSPWHYIFTKYIPIWKFDEEKVIRINLTREEFSPFYFCHILITVIYVYYYKLLSGNIIIFDNSTTTSIFFYSMTFFYAMTKICYYVVHFTNPGILPFNWSETKQRFYTKDELRSGIAINREQKMWGKTHDWPSRSFFSGDYGAIILRADHYCMWINHWVGLKNHKFFIQSLFYCSLFLIEYLFILYKVFKNNVAVRYSSFFYFVLCVCILFVYFNVSNLFDQIVKVVKNITNIEKMSDSGQYSLHDKGVIKNLEEIFGSIYLLPLWFLPIQTKLPVDGFNYPLKKDDVCLAANRNQCYAYIPASFYRKIFFFRIFGRCCG